MDNPNAPFGFFLVTMAGLSTALGAGLVFSQRMVKMASKRVLAGALAVSAGVMLQVSFAEIFVKSQIGFEDAGFSTSNAYLFATLSFFGGMAVGKALDLLVHMVDKSHYHRPPGCLEETSKADIEEGHTTSHDQTADKPSKGDQLNHSTKIISSAELPAVPSPRGPGGPAAGEGEGACPPAAPGAGATAPASAPGKDGPPEDARLVRMGVLMALAIGLHNFPEGLATFVATLDSPRVGGALAIAIGIHNIPEGCVAIPIYYATGSRWRAFGWALVSGASEPVGAALGWLVLCACWSDALYGALFGLVAGMMVNICLRELVPTAHRYDPGDTVASNCLVAGMAVMALSLVLFQY